MEIKRPESNQPMPRDAKKVFNGIIFDVWQWEQELFDGRKVLFEKLKRPDTAVVFPVLDNGQIVLIEEEQPGKKASLGAIGGRIEDGEDVVGAVKRELLEESGYSTESLVLWDAKHPTSKIDWVIYTFIAKGIKQVSDISLDGGEKIKLKPVSFEEFVELASNPSFAEEQIINFVLVARLDPVKMEELKRLFNPKV
jgi:ADP-ribose pyrophosphatase